MSRLVPRQKMMVVERSLRERGHNRRSDWARQVLLGTAVALMRVRGKKQLEGENLGEERIPEDESNK